MATRSRAGELMRLFVVVPLISLIMSCPFLCGTTDNDQDAQRHRPSCCGEGSPAAPVHCHDEGTSCFCQGAVPSASLRSHTINQDLTGPLPFGAPHFNLALALPSHSSAHHRESDDRPAGVLASSRDATAGRALLQNYRC